MIEIEIINDHLFEKDETFMLELSELSIEGAKFGHLKRTVITIVSDDGKWGYPSIDDKRDYPKHRWYVRLS